MEYDDYYNTTTFGPLENGKVTENPKAKWGAAKAPFFGVPMSAQIALGAVMGGGGYKYGMFNYRDTKIAASTYHDAIHRHLALWFDGEDCDPLETDEGKPPGSGVSHLAHVMACCALLIDAQQQEMLDDDRSKTGNVRNQMEASALTFKLFKEAQDRFEENK